MCWTTSVNTFHRPIPDEASMESNNSTAKGDRSAGFPDFDLEYYVDDHDSPTEVTITAVGSADSLATEWITADVADAVPVESIP